MNIANKLQSLPDASLLELCHSEDRNSFAVLVDRYQSLICSLAYGILGDISQSEDLAQEAFLTAWEKRSTLKEPEKFKSWLCGITRNLALRAVRTKQSETQGKSKFQEASYESPNATDSVEKREEQALLWQTLEELPENYREPLILFYREEQSISRVASQLDLTENTVKQRLSRGRRLLKERVATLLEEVLITTKPGPAFTLAVMASLPTILATSAAAAGTAGLTGAGKAITGAGVVSTGALAGALGGLLGGFLGFWVGDQTARYHSQRKVMKHNLIGNLVIIGVFNVPWIAMAVGLWSPASLGTKYVAAWLIWMIGFFATIGWWSFRMGKLSRKLAKTEAAAGTIEQPVTRLRKWLQRWEGRRWNSAKTIFGLPLISIAFEDPDRDFSGYVHPGNGGKQTAKGWIAIGDRAIGFIAIGNLASGGIAIGSICLGVVSCGGIAGGAFAFGGLTLGILSIGGLALGFGSIGGFSAGWWSYGGFAAAIDSAKGGYAIAVNYALGGGANANEANTLAAKEAIESNVFFTWGDYYLSAIQSGWFMPAFFTISILGTLGVLGMGFRRKKKSR